MPDTHTGAERVLFHLGLQHEALKLGQHLLCLVEGQADLLGSQTHDAPLEVRNLDTFNAPQPLPASSLIRHSMTTPPRLNRSIVHGPADRPGLFHTPHARDSDRSLCLGTA